MQSCLRWFGHFQRRAINVPVRNSESIKVKGMKKGVEEEKVTLILVKKDMSIKEVNDFGQWNGKNEYMWPTLTSLLRTHSRP